MTDSHESNIAMMALVARRLGALLNKVVFVGGCVTGLLITDRAIREVRSTVDVDIILEALTYVEFTQLETELRNLGFRNDMSEGAPTCRYIVDGIIVDVMPLDGSTWGFNTKWYPAAARSAFEYVLDTDMNEVKIRVCSAPAFVATKIAAFRDRGKKDFLASRDLSDIIDVLNGRSELRDEIRNAEAELRDFVVAEVSELLTNRAFVDAISGHLLPDAASQARFETVMERMQAIAELNN
jgi:hypothetical protein